MTSRSRPVLACLAVLLAAAACSSAAPTDTIATPTTTAPSAAPTRVDPTAVPSYKPGSLDGTLSDGSKYRLQTPANWNGTLLLWSHGYRFPGSDNPVEVGPPGGAESLLAFGYALAGSAYPDGWSVEQAVPDQLSVLTTFETKVGKPVRVIAWGASLGGLVTASLTDARPAAVDGAISLCGVLDPVGAWNQALDASYAMRELLVPGVALSGDKDPQATYAAMKQKLAAAQQTAPGRARIALAMALGGVPTWASGSTKPTGAAQQEASQYAALTDQLLTFAVLGRADLEKRAGGTYSWNTGVDYAAQLDRSPNKAQVTALYAAAKLPLAADLGKLAAGKRVSAQPDAVAYVVKNHQPAGTLPVPVLTVHTVGDPLVVPTQERAYAQVVAKAGRADDLRQAYTDHAGHCSFTAGEVFAALSVMGKRLDNDAWPNTTPAGLTALAGAVGGGTFLQYAPAEPLRLGSDTPR